ncbi:unnamed protein product [Fraxinus pennsylvanica]|uniref:Non-specific serine/threonine protein kinase n=1 Tax=Fraxinus pennsylvanica TaxID=56036 RepID=A0AAD1ZUQ6_9LAMI|nr:unnamed protein product [Fraxinus pennsylvanica]
MSIGRRISIAFILSYYLFVNPPAYADTERDTILDGQPLEDRESLSSANKVFRLKFFSPRNSSRRFRAATRGPGVPQFSKQVWVANRDTPIVDASGSLMIDNDGKLKITSSRGDVPSVFNSVHGTNRSFAIGGDPNGTNQNVVWYQGNVYWTSVNWSNGHFGNLPKLLDGEFRYVSNENEKYLTYSVNKNISFLYFRIDPVGVMMGIVLGSFGDCSLAKQDEGCVKKTLPECRKPDYWFESRAGYMLGDGYRYGENYNLSIFDCQDKCEQNCSCVAYASRTTLYGTGCEIWSKETNFYPSGYADREIYILKRDTGRESTNDHGKHGSAAGHWWVWLITALGGTILLAFSIICYVVQRNLRVKVKTRTLLDELEVSITASGKYGQPSDEMDKMTQVNFFSFESIAMATNNFSYENKLGEGGFGPVFKGELPGGQEIAIKKLSQREEKILVYEYMPNKSLDFFLFDSSRRELLNWTDRMNIIEGIAQGLLYLHKIFGVQQTEANTKRIVGTYGYMSPEYAMKGIVSMKSDVFSFGVLLLEIVSGKRNYSRYPSEHPFNLIGFAWELWMEKRVLELMDSRLDDSSSKNKIVRCINVGLLCVQDQAKDRPSMTEVVSMLTNDSARVPVPKQPAFFIESGAREGELETNLVNNCTNVMSITVMEAR